MLSKGLQGDARLDRASAALREIILFDGVDRGEIELEPLGSLTNLSYRVTVGNKNYVLRLPG